MWELPTCRSLVAISSQTFQRMHEHMLIFVSPYAHLVNSSCSCIWRQRVFSRVLHAPFRGHSDSSVCTVLFIVAMVGDVARNVRHVFPCCLHGELWSNSMCAQCFMWKSCQWRRHVASGSLLIAYWCHGEVDSHNTSFGVSAVAASKVLPIPACEPAGIPPTLGQRLRPFLSELELVRNGMFRSWSLGLGSPSCRSLRASPKAGLHIPRLLIIDMRWSARAPASRVQHVAAVVCVTHQNAAR